MYSKIRSQLFSQADNSSIIVFRILFGLILLAETLVDILRGRVQHAFIAPHYRFPYISFEFLHPLPGNGMYYYFWVMAVLAIMITIGAYYRLAVASYTLLWGISYLMDKTGYQNHYYLVLLLCFLMIFVPANTYCSVDVKRKPHLRQLSCPRWVSMIFIAQVAIMYCYSGLNKLYPDWLNGTYIHIMLGYKSHFPFIGTILKHQWLQWCVVYGGIFFDLFIVSLLLWRRTRKVAFVLAVLFHVFNLLFFRIGLFPYLALSLCVFFFDPEDIRKLFFKKKPAYIPTLPAEIPTPKQGLMLYGFGLYFIIQTYYPPRHLLYPGNTMWTEEGSRLSWRMMLRIKTGELQYRIINRDTKQDTIIEAKNILTPPQLAVVTVSPDMIWQLAQYLKQDFAKRGMPNVEIYAISTVSLNHHPAQALIDPQVDLGKVKWAVFGHSEWVEDY